VWRGDITTLRVDGIVNAANEYMLYALRRCSRARAVCVCVCVCVRVCVCVCV
jgi:hypothetical protein